MAADIAILNAAGIAVHKEILRRNRINADFLSAGFARHFHLGQGWHYRHAHFIKRCLLRDFLFKDFRFRVHAKELHLIFCQVAILVNFNMCRLINVNLPHANLLFQRVINRVRKDLKAVVSVKDISGIVGLFRRFLHRLRLARDKLYRPIRLQENPHQRRFNRAQCIAALCGDNVRPPFLCWQVYLAVKVFLRLDPLRCDFRLDEINRLSNGVFDCVLDLVAR